MDKVDKKNNLMGRTVQNLLGLAQDPDITSRQAEKLIDAAGALCLMIWEREIKHLIFQKNQEEEINGG